MSPEQTQQLINVYPPIFKDLVVNSPLAMFGIECGPGWFGLLKECVEGIGRVCEREGLDIKVDQIKEKYGTLRFYISSGIDEIYEIIHKAEDKSEITCEMCGKPGELRGGTPGDYWMCVRCEPCNEDRLRKKL